MYCMGINHKTAPAAIREKYSMTCEEKQSFADMLKISNEVTGVVLLMTCNRFEIYFTGGDRGFTVIENAIAGLKGVEKSAIRKLFMRYDDAAALKHLYTVACGLDSAVIGEVEIIRQLRDAYKYSGDNKLLNTEINICFQGALSLAKDVAEKSLMTRLPVSVGTLTAEAVAKRTGDMENPKVLIVGASGSIGSIVLKDLASASNKLQLIATIRKHRIDCGSIPALEKVKFINYDERYDYLAEADVIISATSGPHYTFLADVTAEKLTGCDREHLFIDLAVPRDIDPDIADIRNCEIKDIDYIKELAKDNNQRKLTEAQRIKILIDERVEEQRKKLLFRHYAANVPAIRERLKDKSFSALLYKLRDNLDYDTLSKVLDTIKEEEDGIFSLYDSIRE